MRDRFRRRRRGWRRLLPRLVTIVLIGFLAWLGGLVYFTTLIPGSVEDEDTAADAIVVQYLPDDTCQPSDLPFCGVDMRPLLARIGAQVAQRYLPT